MRDRTNTWRERGKGLVKNSEIANIPIYNAIIQIPMNL